MQQPTAIQYPISDILEWEVSKKLVIAPKFQRRNVWIPKAKSFLIDTIIRSMPIPPIFIRQRVDPKKQITVREVIDGQQRLRAVLEFIKGEFPIMETHNKEYGGMYYANLPDNVISQFLGYKFVVNVFEDISDQEVLNVFSRINTYTVRLNAQELRNAEYFGPFKQSVYKLGFQHYAFWINNKILSDSKIARMDEAELVSELIITMLNGIQQTKSSDINKMYKKFDEDFPQKEIVERQFSEIIDLIADMFQGSLSSSEFRRIPLFYSLFVLLFDAKYGLPNSEFERVQFNASEIRRIAGILKGIDSTIQSKQIPAELEQFVEFTRLSTADPGKRQYRHKFLWAQISPRL